MIKRIINISGWITFGAGVLILLNFTLKSKNISVVQKPLIEIDEFTDNEFVNDEMILKDLLSKGYSFQNQLSNDVLLREIEQLIMDYPAVKTVDVYKDLSGKIGIDVLLKKPIVRVFDKKGNSAYIDEDGKAMTLSDVYTSRVVVFSGDIEGDLNNFDFKDTIFKNQILRAIYHFSSFVDKDEFWNAQVEQVYVNKEKEFEIIPKVGDHRILFGNTDQMDLKFRKLKAFYMGITPKQWNVYDTIDLRYKEQVVCSKK